MTDESAKPKGHCAMPAPTTSASSTLLKHKAVKLEDSGQDTSGSGGTRKRAWTNVEDDVLSRPEAAELLGTIIMELDVIDHSMAKIQETMATFAASANGKKWVVVHSSLA
jgi:hypothetical protein